MAVLLNINMRSAIQYVPLLFNKSKTEGSSDEASVHFAIPLASLMTIVPTDDVYNTEVPTFPTRCSEVRAHGSMTHTLLLTLARSPWLQPSPLSSTYRFRRLS